MNFAGTPMWRGGGVAKEMRAALKRCLRASVAAMLALTLLPALAFAEEGGIEGSQPSFAHLESAHDYTTGMDETYTYTWDEAATYGMAVTFDAQTATESGYDFIYVYDGADNELGKYSGSQLAGVTVYVPQSSTVKIRLTSDGSNNAWGFKVADIATMTGNDLSLAGAIAFIPSQLLDAGSATPSPAVTYGAKTLIQGQDYSVSYAENTVVGQATVTATGINDYTGSIQRSFAVVSERVLPLSIQTTTGQYNTDRGTSVSFDASIESLDEVGAWKAAITSAMIGDTAIDPANISVATSRWGGTLSLPGEAWGLTEDTRSNEPQTKTLTIVAAGYPTLTVELTAAPVWGTSLTVQRIDANGTVISEKSYEFEDLQGMFKTGYTHVYCDAAGLGSNAATGVRISDLLVDNGIVTDKEKLTFKFLTGDGWAVTTTGAYLYDERYYFPVFFDNTTTYAELGGETIADYLVNGPADSGDRAINGYITRSQAVRTLVAQTVGTTAQPTEPLLAYTYDYTQPATDGHLGGQGSGVSTAPVMGVIDRESYQRSYRLLFGMRLDQNDPTMVANETTRSVQTYCVNTVQVYDPNYTEFAASAQGISATLDTTGSSYDRAAATKAGTNDRNALGERTTDAAGWALSFAPATDEGLSAAVAADGNTVVDMFSATLTKGADVAPIVTGFGTISVNIDLDDEARGAYAMVYDYDADGSVRSRRVAVENGQLAFDVSNLGTVAYALIDEPVVNPDNPGDQVSPGVQDGPSSSDPQDEGRAVNTLLQTGDDMPITLLAACAAGALLLLAVAWVARRGKGAPLGLHGRK